MKWFLIPLALFLGLASFLAVGLSRDPHEIPSPLVGRQAPLFALPQLGADTGAPKGRFSPVEMRGKVWMLNVWASWCGSCREEHPVLMDLAKSGAVPLIGLDYKDGATEARALLAKNGDPYLLSAVDRDGRVGMDYGVYGVPETYVIDKAGLIRYKQIGPVTDEVLKSKILPLIKELQK